MDELRGSTRQWWRNFLDPNFCEQYLGLLLEESWHTDGDVLVCFLHELNHAQLGWRVLKCASASIGRIQGDAFRVFELGKLYASQLVRLFGSAVGTEQMGQTGEKLDNK